LIAAMLWFEVFHVPAQEGQDAADPAEFARDQSSNRCIPGFCFAPVIVVPGELAESLSAVPPDETWKTYL
jgi:hypothetical protein